MPTKRRFRQVVRKDGSSYLEEVKVPRKSEFEMDNQDYLNEPEYKGYKHVRTLKAEKMLAKGYSRSYAKEWDRLFNKGKLNGKEQKARSLTHRRAPEKAGTGSG